MVEQSHIALKRVAKRSYNVYLVSYTIVLCVTSVVYKIFADEFDETYLALYSNLYA